jgi:SAM-dependent methyltransferase
MNVMGMKSFFYAEADADLYDATVRFTTEPYDLLHAQVQRLVSYWERNRQRHQGDRPLIVNLGCGTGMEAFPILKNVQSADLICIDISERMLSILRQKLIRTFGDETCGGRCWTVRGDVRDGDVISSAIATAGFARRPVSLAVSVYALHHLTAIEKKETYSAIARALSSESAFVCGDMYSFADQKLGQFAQSMEERWIANAFERGAETIDLVPEELKRLTETWLKHSREENIPLPIYQSEPPSDPGRLDTEAALLLAAGFRRLDVPFRFFQNGIIWAEV